ncbi:MAG: hypothetical protein ABII13_05920 [Patescibacteria group bacterium]|nr:hypothetical protein [Patescibacteria group bacterium]MBU2509034.1 hypothetical protein [Patescibacteria group bacterium]
MVYKEDKVFDAVLWIGMIVLMIIATVLLRLHPCFPTSIDAILGAAGIFGPLIFGIPFCAAAIASSIVADRRERPKSLDTWRRK